MIQLLVLDYHKYMILFNIHLYSPTRLHQLMVVATGSVDGLR